MPNWAEVFNEINEYSQAHAVAKEIAMDVIRKKYLLELHQKTGRNVIAYYSGWLQKPGLEGTQINDDDKNCFMSAIHGLDCRLGLDLILHTPGGDIAATESIIDYLHRKFINTTGNIDVRVIVPLLAMSAGTMIACSGNSILMGKQSSLGPIDPQLKGLPAYGVIQEFNRAHTEIKLDNTKLAVWQFILQKYHPTFLSECQNAIDLASDLVLSNLQKVMFKGDTHAKIKAKKIVDYLTDYSGRKTHGRHINIDECENIGLKLELLEIDKPLQDLVLTTHHCFMHLLANTSVFKITENHNGTTQLRMQV